MTEVVPKTTVSLPLPVVRNGSHGSLADRYAAEREEFEALLLRHGALLFRGYDVDSQENLARAVRGIGGDVLDYVDGNSPPKKLGSGVYTSPESPPVFFISLHTELLYSSRWPSRL